MDDELKADLAKEEKSRSQSDWMPLDVHAGVIGGRTTPPELRVGHAGAIVAGGTGDEESKIEAMPRAGIVLARSPGRDGSEGDQGETMGRDASMAAFTPQNLTWALCVATYNRIDMLEVCVRHALKSTRMPAEIVIVDASADWEGNSRRIAPMAEASGVPLRYLPAPKKSLPAQRNHGITAATSDILFLIDDDALLYPDCADAILRVYEADRDQRIAAVSASDGPMPTDTGLVAEAKTGLSKAPLTARLLRSLPLVRFIWVEVLMMSADRVFIPYDRQWHRPDAATVTAYASETVYPLTTIAGYRLTVRRAVALAEPFDNDLLAYASAEDLDATYRFSRHGWNVVATDGKIYHHEAMAGRLKRQQSTMLSVLNIAFLLRKHSRFPVLHTIQFYVMILRRLLAETLKDGLSRRWQYPQLRGVAASIPETIRILRHDRATLGQYYDTIQRKVLGLPPASALFVSCSIAFDVSSAAWIPAMLI
jgi:glycosyltransferase involved in cell wall biosynthesis